VLNEAGNEKGQILSGERAKGGRPRVAGAGVMWAQDPAEAVAADAARCAHAGTASEVSPPQRKTATRPVVPLSDMDRGARFCVRALGGDAAMVRRLMDLGLRIGVPAVLLQKGPAGYVIAMDGMRLAIDRRLAGRILVRPCPLGGKEGAPAGGGAGA
jgi:Fe2+ transport system protein FeoA